MSTGPHLDNAVFLGYLYERFLPLISISYALSEPAFVSLRVCDVFGREVSMLVNERQTAGPKAVQFDASDLASGVYFYQLRAGSYLSTKKLLMLR